MKSKFAHKILGRPNNNSLFCRKHSLMCDHKHPTRTLPQKSDSQSSATFFVYFLIKRRGVHPVQAVETGLNNRNKQIKHTIGAHAEGVSNSLHIVQLG